LLDSLLQENTFEIGGTLNILKTESER